jgi:hypothetical protein
MFDSATVPPIERPEQPRRPSVNHPSTGVYREGKRASTRPRDPPTGPAIPRPITTEETTMTHNTATTTIALALGLAATTTLPALAAAPATHHSVTSASSTRALKALDDRWNAEAKYFLTGNR